MNFLERFSDWLDPYQNGPWYFKKTLLMLLCVAALGAVLFFYGVGFTETLNTIFYYPLLMPTHEAGHKIIGLIVCPFGSCEPFAHTLPHLLMVYAGTFFQELWPVIFFVYFLKNGYAKSADFCLFWLGVSFTQSRAYIADARALDLPLIGQVETGIADIHDWNQILYYFNALDKDILLSKIYFGIGCFFIALSVYCFFYHLKYANKKKDLGTLLTEEV